LIFSSVPSGFKTSQGSLTKLQHFDSKAEISDYIEEIKKNSNMLTTHYLPAVFMDIVKIHTVRGPDGTPTCFSPMDPAVTLWPLIDIRADTGKWVASILEAGEAANGARVQAVGEWLRIPTIFEQMFAALGCEVRYQHLSREEYEANFPEALKGFYELSATLQFVQDYGVYGKGMEKKQYELGDKWLLQGMKKTTWFEYVKNNGPWEW
jgi:NmrA-like family